MTIINIKYAYRLIALFLTAILAGALAGNAEAVLLKKKPYTIEENTVYKKELKAVVFPLQGKTDEEQTDGVAANEAIEILEKHAKSKEPFFLAVGLYRPHTPYVAPKKYFDMYPIENIKVPTVPEGYVDSLPEGAKLTVTAKKSNLNLKKEIARQAIQAYYASITFADAQIGRILKALKSTGLDENTS